MHEISNLNKEQQYAVNFCGKHLLVLAGAGTGKTHTIISRARKLIEEDGVLPTRIIILSFTRKSAQEIATRIKIGLDSNKTKGLIGRTFHSWCNELILIHKNAFVDYGFTLMDEDDRESCFKLVCGRNIKTVTGEKIKPKTFSQVCSYMVNKQCSLTEAIRNKFVEYRLKDADGNYIIDISEDKVIFEDVIKKYIAYKQNRNYLDYDDLLMIVAKMLKKNTELRNYITSKYEHILVDEVQDTNPLQYELLSAFYDKCHLFCVGDNAQSIYGFRGADFNTIHNFTQVVPDSESCKLTVNYRSVQEILDLSDWVLAQSPLNYNKKLKAIRGHGAKPCIIHYENEWEEADDITEKILTSVSMHNLKYKDNLVLSRSVWGLRQVEACCVKKKIPYVLFGGSGLMRSAHVRDIAAAMRIIANYKDELAWSRYLQLWKGIGEVSAAKIIDKVIEKDSLDNSLMSLMEQNLESPISDTLLNITKYINDPVNAISGALKGMKTRLQELYKEDWETWRKNDFDLLKEVAKGTGSITEFISEYVLDPKVETMLKTAGENKDHVVLSTIHQAKGLEAEYCYIINVSPSAYPTSRAILEGEDVIEEERRCLYVAMTRAKDKLFLYRDITMTHAYTESDKKNNSKYFLNELPENYIENKYINSLNDKEIDWTGASPKLNIGDFYDFN